MLSSAWPAGVTDECFWGLPSIAADDPAFAAGGYWRQPTWGPMVQLTYWGLNNYAHVPEVAAAKSALTALPVLTDEAHARAAVAANFRFSQGTKSGTKGWKSSAS
jgi:hypothetical protein